MILCSFNNQSLHSALPGAGHQEEQFPAVSEAHSLQRDAALARELSAMQDAEGGLEIIDGALFLPYYLFRLSEAHHMDAQ